MVLQQRFQNTMKFRTSLSHPLSNATAHHGWAQRKIFNIGTPRFPEKAVLGIFVVNKLQKENPNVFSLYMLISNCNYFTIINTTWSTIYNVTTETVELHSNPVALTLKPHWPHDSIFHSIFSSTFDLKVERLLSVVEHMWQNGSIFTQQQFFRPIFLTKIKLHSTSLDSTRLTQQGGHAARLFPRFFVE